MSWYLHALSVLLKPVLALSGVRKDFEWGCTRLGHTDRLQNFLESSISNDCYPACYREAKSIPTASARSGRCGTSHAYFGTPLLKFYLHDAYFSQSVLMCEKFEPASV